LNERDRVRVKHDEPRGILSARAAEATNRLSRYRPSAELAPFVEHYWIVRWDLSEPRITETVPHPSIHMTLESSGTSDIVGVMRTKFSRLLEGRGRVVGTKFRPGAFRPFVKQPVSTFTGRRLPVREVFGARAADLAERVMGLADDREGIAIIESFLRGLNASPDDSMALAGRVALRIADDRGITRVDQLAREFSTRVRQLQRLFKEYIGVSPKWVIQRYRLSDAADRMAAGTIVNWPDLALELGYADQAHFIRDFKRLVGHSPADYARRLERGDRSRHTVVVRRATTSTK
jgi:AraC-like DNA-binding protein